MNFPTTLRAALVLGLAASSVAAQNLMSQHGEVVLAAGQDAPGLPGYTIYAASAFAYGSPVIDANGTILVQAQLAPTGIDDRAIFLGRNGSDMQLVVQSASPAPGLPGLILKSSSTTSGSGLENDPIISPFGEILFFGSSINDPITPANTPTSSDHAIFWGPAGGLQLLAREGTQVPMLPAGITYGSTSFSRQYSKINSSGTITFNNDLGGTATSADDACLITGVPGALTIVAREGDPVPGLPGLTWAAASGGTMSFMVSLNEANEILFAPKVAGAGVTTSNDSVVCIYQPSVGVTILAREGDQAPGFPAGTVWTGSPALNSPNFGNNGNMLVGWALSDGGINITTANDQCLWYGGLGGFTLVVQEGDSTGLPGGETFGVFNNTSMKVNQNGTFAFFCSLRDAAGGALPTTSDTTMVVGTPGNWTFVVREGSVIPEIPPSTNGSWECRSVSGSTNLNGRGQLLFNQSCTDTVGIKTHYLVWDPDLGLQVLQDATAQYTTVLGTGTATTSVSNAGTQGNADSSPLWFNNAGDMTFRQSIDGSVVSAIVRGHVGSLYGTPASLDSAAGGTHTFTVDAGPAHANNFYAIIGSQSGTRPGTVLPAFGPLTIPLNFDAYTTLTVNFFNTPIFSNTLWFTDSLGQATASFHLPPATGLTGLFHHAVVGLDLNLMETFVSGPVSLKLN